MQLPDKNPREIVLSRISRAKELFEQYGQGLLKDPCLTDRLELFAAEIEKSKELMSKLNVPGTCSYCATSIKGGGCCGEQVATWFDPVLLLLNLLMGVPLQDKGYYEGSCIFLGKDGCTLKARYHFCVNYLCKRLIEMLGENGVEALRRQYGKELFLSWELEVCLGRMLPQHLLLTETS